MNLIFNIGIMIMLVAFTYFNYTNFKKGLNYAGNVLIEMNINKYVYFSGVFAMMILYPVSIVLKGVDFNSVIYSSIGILLIVMASFIVTYKSSAFYICENGIVIKNVFYEYKDIKKYSFIQGRRKMKIVLDLKGKKGRELRFFYTVTEEEKLRITKIFKEKMGKKGKLKK